MSSNQCSSQRSLPSHGRTHECIINKHVTADHLVVAVVDLSHTNLLIDPLSLSISCFVFEFVEGIKPSYLSSAYIQFVLLFFDFVVAPCGLVRDVLLWIELTIRINFNHLYAVQTNWYLQCLCLYKVA